MLGRVRLFETLLILAQIKLSPVPVIVCLLFSSVGVTGIAWT